MLIPILMYHSVTARGDAFSIDERLFDEHLAVIRDSGRTPLTITALASALAGGFPLPARPMALTFDDGTADFSRSALPGLLDARLSATLYVTTAHIGGSGMLSWSEVVQAASQGVEVGAHSRHHPHLDTVSHSRMRREIVGSRADVEDRVGHACRSFAYPHGSYNRTVRQLVIDAGFSSAVAVRNAFSHEADDVFALARLTVRGNTGPERLADWLAGAGAPLVPQRELLRTTVYRQVRRARAMLHPVPEVVS